MLRTWLRVEFNTSGFLQLGSAPFGFAKTIHCNTTHFGSVHFRQYNRREQTKYCMDKMMNLRGILTAVLAEAVPAVLAAKHCHWPISSRCTEAIVIVVS